MMPASSTELYKYRVFINEAEHIRSLFKNSSNEDSIMKLTRLSETLSYLEEQIAEISSRIP